MLHGDQNLNQYVIHNYLSRSKTRNTDWAQYNTTFREHYTDDAYESSLKQVEE